MKKNVAVWILVATLLTFVIIRAGRYSFTNNYSVENHGPSGSSAFIELLKRSGYKVTVDNELKPDLGGFSTAVAIVAPRNAKEVESFAKRMKNQKKLVVFQIPDIVKEKSTRQVKNSGDNSPLGSIEGCKEVKTEWNFDSSSYFGSDTLSLLLADSSSLAYIASFYNHQVFVHEEGATITNKYIDKSDNASIALGLVNLAAPKDKKLLVLGAFASADGIPGLVERMGKFVQGGWNQLIVLIAVIFVTLSVRFGFAPETRVAQRGSRELVDGLATLAQGKRQAQWTLQALIDKIIRDLEKRHRVGREQLLGRNSPYLTQEERDTISQAMQAASLGISEREAIEHSKALKRLV